MEHNTQDESITQLVQEATLASYKLLRDEIRLIREEAKMVAARLAKDGALAAAYGFLLALSTVPFVAFLVIGLGRILNDNYWLSSLIVSVLMATPAAILAIRMVRQIKEHDLEMKHTKAVLEKEARMASEKLSEINAAATRRAG